MKYIFDKFGGTMIKRLSELKVGEYATIQLVFGRGRMRTRMFDMGITPSAKIFFRKTAPMGDPMQIIAPFEVPPQA